MQKKCSKCGETKDVSEFYIHAVLDGEFRPSCKECIRFYQRGYYYNNT